MERRTKLEKLMKPSSIAVIGASESEGTVGHAILKNLISSGFKGRLFPINPKYAGQEVHHDGDGHRMLTYIGSVEELPEHEVDLALIMTPSKTVPDILDILGAKQVPAAVVVTAGFKEIGAEGLQLTQKVQNIAEKHQMVMVGPNCLGIADTDPSIQMNATFAQNTPPHGNVAIFSQSGAIGIDIIDQAQRLGLGVAQFVSLGNELQTSPAELLQYWQEEPAVKYILGYMEGIKSLGKIRDIASKLTKTKPILMIKSGTSSIGAKAAKSHTGALAGNNAAVDALFTQTGIQRFDSIHELFMAAQAFEYANPSLGKRVAIFSNAGGYAVMASDLLEPEFLKNQGLVAATFLEETVAELERLLPHTASKKNPVDTTATAPMDNLENYKQALQSILNDAHVDACIVPIIPLMGMPIIEIAMAIAEVQHKTQKPLMIMISTGESHLTEIRQALQDAKLPSLALYSSIEDTILALGALERHRQWVQRAIDYPSQFLDMQQQEIAAILEAPRSEKRFLLTTSESLLVLKASGIRVARFKVVQTLEEALRAVKQLGYPLAIKLNSKTISHKTEVGGVKVDIRNEEELIRAFREMMAQLETHGITTFGIGEGIMLQEFLPRGREVIIGASEDPDLGKLLMFGRGGIYAQLDQDVTFRLNPLTRQDAREMIASIKAYRILQGYRGKPGVDLEALEDTILRLSQLISDFPEIIELDINPYLALAKESGERTEGVAVDSRIVLRAQ